LLQCYESQFFESSKLLQNGDGQNKGLIALYL
jgi:hypothetical protein